MAKEGADCIHCNGKGKIKFGLKGRGIKCKTCKGTGRVWIEVKR